MSEQREGVNVKHPRRLEAGGFWSERHWVARCVSCNSHGDFYPSPRTERKYGEEEARYEGWSKTKEGWMCPSCVESRKTQP